MACGGGCCGSTNAQATKQVNDAARATETLNEETGPSVTAVVAIQDTDHGHSSEVSEVKDDKDACADDCCTTSKEPLRGPDSDATNGPEEKTSCCSPKADDVVKPKSCCSPAPASEASVTTKRCNAESIITKSDTVESCCSLKIEIKKPGNLATKVACCSTTPAVVVSNSKATVSCCETKSSSNCCSSTAAPAADELTSRTPQACCGSAVGADCCIDALSVSSESCADGCCGPEKEDTTGCGISPVEADKHPTPQAKDDCCATKSSSGCCTSKSDPIVRTTEIDPHDVIDIERGITGFTHANFSISGMTCTGCETKLQRTLDTLPYVRNLKTSLVLARVELDIFGAAATPEDIVKHLHRTTEFKCEVISNQGCGMDLILDGDVKKTIDGDWPDGVLEVKAVGKDGLRVEFDAKLIGARDLLNSDWGASMRLAPLSLDASLDAGSRHVRHMMLMTLLSAILTIPVLVMSWAPLPEREIAYGSASLALATIVQVVIAGPFYPKALKALIFSKVIEMDLLIVLSTSAAYIFSVVAYGYMVAGDPLSMGEFFETSTLLVTLIMVGRWVASLARQKAAESISIRSLQTPTAILVNENGTEEEIDARLLQFGDIFKVAPDTRIPTDGTVISGISELDESMLTGESKPVYKQTGSPVIAGSINGSGMITVRLTRLPGDNTITTIACMVDEAKLSKPKIQEIADKVASYFVPVVVALTIITFVIWIAIGVAVRNQSGSEATIEAITYAITVLIVSCPCAIGLAVPMVIVIASGVAAKRGVVFKSANSIEVAYKTTDVVFDKTGTLTTGQLSVIDEVYIGKDNKLTQSMLLGLLTNIKHPVSAAVAQHLESQGISSTTIANTKVLPGKGVQGVFNKKTLRAGNSRWLDMSEHTQVRAMLSKGLTTFCFSIDNTLVATFGLQDTLRPDAEFTVSALQACGINTHILSGDDDGAVKSIGAQLAISPANIRSRCSPSDKQTYIKDLLSNSNPTNSGRKSQQPVVLFVGDGTNDAPSLAQATIGVHISTGTDIAQSAADVVLVRPHLSNVLTIINVSRKAMHRVAFNFGWSFTYNLFAVLLGAGAFVRARIPPEYAGLGELVSVLPVVGAAVALKWAKI
ncbi:heavy metal translocatin [Plenodomus tracheiphilus IPT5]|uniref:Heavy metal translocatin n=1 Tax=Plenodomus tracheiphilus IPT5 TaxID=1408161 RepID=A0A6A7ASH8_9PLEO|nr:heavy metal translocatin [Plenodomus tracheiphilus IPT5]